MIFVPFGYEEQLRNERKAGEIITPDNVEYLDVTVINKKDGSVVPLSFIWDDCEVKIDKVLSCVPGISLKTKLSGARYKCRAKNKDFYLCFDGAGWYLAT